MHQNRLAAIEKEIGSLRRTSDRSTRPAAGQLSVIMMNHNYLMPALDARREMMESGYANGTINRMKTELGIGSMKGKDGVWYWVWGSEEVIEWIDQKLSLGPMSLTDLYNMAWHEKGWSPEVLQAAKATMGYVTLRSVFNREDMTRTLGWVDINHPPENDPEPDEERKFTRKPIVIEDPGYHARNDETEG
jgi:hypothetical protein